MDEVLTRIVQVIQGGSHRKDLSGYKEVRNILNSKIDLWMEMAQTMDDQNGTKLLHFVSFLNEDFLSTYGCLLLLAYQAEYMPNNLGIHELFIVEFQRLMSLVRNDDSKQYELFKEMFLVGSDRFAFICAKISDRFGLSNVTKPGTVDEPFGRPDKDVIPLLEHAVALSAPRPSCLTAAHCYLMQLCAEHRMYDYGVRHMESHPIFEINPKQAYLSPEEYVYW